MSFVNSVEVERQSISGADDNLECGYKLQGWIVSGGQRRGREGVKEVEVTEAVKSDDKEDQVITDAQDTTRDATLAEPEPVTEAASAPTTIPLPDSPLLQPQSESALPVDEQQASGLNVGCRAYADSRNGGGGVQVKVFKRVKVEHANNFGQDINILVEGLFLQLTEAQSFAVPSKLRKPTTTLSRQDRLTLVNGLLDTVHPTLNTTTGMFQGDRISNTPFWQGTEYRHLVRTSVKLLVRSLVVPNVDASTSYGVSPLNSDSTDDVYDDFIIQIANNANNTVLNSETIGMFLALSVHLYEQTQDPQYLSAAQLSASFVTTVLYDGNAIRDGTNLGTCDAANDFWTSNSSVVIEGLSVLASIHSTYTPRLNSLISATIPYSQWTNVSDGVMIKGPTISEDANSIGVTFEFKAILVRGRTRRIRGYPVTRNSTEASFIQSFITVQLNALTDLSSITGNNLYSPKWEGPPPTQLLPWGQVDAVDILNADMGLAEDASNTMSLSPRPTSKPQCHISKKKIKLQYISPGAIGRIVSGVIVLSSLLSILLFVVICKR
ncbi:hypothetical protein BDY19DRAFT_908628 [Irpex rosettiformis]|uniref:Uncharacterized protein n=1 Tax=Irpex rosettiformis TaxID=378272 RepID=A0ACB8TVP4_9APHY|nr:hypothetical protein BDY19DRAFT_908628 [Irpex rosettiformis]